MYCIFIFIPASVRDLQATASSARADGAHRAFVNLLGDLGAGGRWDGNMERDLHRRLRQEFDINIKPYPLFLPISGPNGKTKLLEVHKQQTQKSKNKQTHKNTQTKNVWRCI